MSSFRLGSDAYGEERGKEEKYFLHPKKTVLTKSFELPPDYAASSPKVQFHGRPTQRGGGEKKAPTTAKRIYTTELRVCVWLLASSCGRVARLLTLPTAAHTT